MTLIIPKIYNSGENELIETLLFIGPLVERRTNSTTYGSNLLYWLSFLAV